MEYADTEKIALYLNLAAIKIKDGNGALRWLTGDGTTIAYDNTTVSEETQCLAFGSALWIANNDDGDSIMQRTFLNRMGITKPAKLLKHVETYYTRLFSYHAATGALVTGGMTGKE